MAVPPEPAGCGKVSPVAVSVRVRLSRAAPLRPTATVDAAS